ncbi:MAG: DUF4097 family beta strand repeat-containing protein [Turicibacter sp.]|nr:DUF4097 family beta strand repeat-containing protein [Turicibacter sp.]
MKEERMKILEMLQDGKITADEAARLLAHIPADNAKPYMFRTNGDSDEDFFENGGGFFGNIVDVFSNLNPNTPKEHFQLQSESSQLPIKELKLSGKNGGISLEGHKEDYIDIHCTYRPKRNANVHIELIENDGSYKLEYNADSVRSMAISCKVPMAVIERLRLKSSNSSITAQDVKCQTLEAYTSNSPIKLENLSANDITAITSNSNISFEEITAESAKFETQNAKIEAYDFDVSRISLKTSNAPIRIGGIRCSKMQQRFDYIIKAATSNAPIALRIPKETGLKLSAQTSRGSIKCDLEDGIITEEISPGMKPKMRGRNSRYNNDGYGFDVKLSSSNGSIKIEN